MKRVSISLLSLSVLFYLSYLLKSGDYANYDTYLCITAYVGYLIYFSIYLLLSNNINNIKIHMFSYYYPILFFIIGVIIYLNNHDNKHDYFIIINFMFAIISMLYSKKYSNSIKMKKVQNQGPI